MSKGEQNEKAKDKKNVKAPSGKKGPKVHKKPAYVGDGKKGPHYRNGSYRKRRKDIGKPKAVQKEALMVTDPGTGDETTTPEIQESKDGLPADPSVGAELPVRPDIENSQQIKTDMQECPPHQADAKDRLSVELQVESDQPVEVTVRMVSRASVTLRVVRCSNV
jgi:hypothetical protein